MHCIQLNNRQCLFTVSVRQLHSAPQTFADYLFADFPQDLSPANLSALAEESGISHEPSVENSHQPFT
jgi:hypothetical protein